MTAVLLPREPRRGRGSPLRSFRTPLVIIAALVAFVVVLAIGRLALLAVEKYGWGIPAFYWEQVFQNEPLRAVVLNTAIVVACACTLATFLAAVLAWLNERTDAGIGNAGRLLPLIPFLMPAIALPLGWIFLASPRVGILNVIIRDLLGRIGIQLQTGPLDILGWPGLIFLYTVFLCGFAYLNVSSAMQTLDSGLEEAGKMAGARPLRILFRITLPALRPALLSTFLICVIPALGMVSVPIVIGTGAKIDVLSVHILRLVTARYPPAFEQAFLLGLLLVVPILVLSWIQRRSAARGRIALIGGRTSSAVRLRLGRTGKIVGRALFFGYVFIGVILPLCGLLFVAGVSFWSAGWPDSWNVVKNIQTVTGNSQVQKAIVSSVTLAIVTGVALLAAAQMLTYGQRLFPRLGPIVDGLAKSPAGIAHLLIAIGLLLALGGAPFRLAGTAALLFIGYFVVNLPFATIITTGAQQTVGRDLIEAARMAGATDLKTFLRILTPLTRAPLVAGFLLVFVLVAGDMNVSLVLSSTGQPVIGFLMLDYFEFGAFPQAATFALLITCVSLSCVTALVGLLNGPLRRR